MELEKKVKMRAEDSYSLRGKCIAYKREAVQGVRGLADFFTH
jgi:hypothetical protein